MVESVTPDGKQKLQRAVEKIKAQCLKNKDIKN